MSYEHKIKDEEPVFCIIHNYRKNMPAPSTYHRNHRALVQNHRALVQNQRNLDVNPNEAEDMQERHLTEEEIESSSNFINFYESIVEGLSTDITLSSD